MTSLPSRTIRRAAAAVAAIAAATLVLSACAGSSTPADTTSTEAGADASYGDLAVQLSWIKNEEFAGDFFALENGYYEEVGFSSVTLTPGPSTGAAELISGTADIAFSDAVSIGTVVAAEGAPLKIIGSVYQKNPFTILSLADGGNILTPEDLKGKKIGVQDSNTALFKALLAANGIEESELEIVPVQYDPAPLTNGEVDGFMAYLTNESITVAAAGFETANLPFADNGLPFVAETITTTDALIESSRDMLKAYLVAEIKGWTDAVNDPEEGARLAYEVYGADLDLNPENSIAGSIAQSEGLVVSADTEEYGLFWITPELQEATIASLAGAGITLTAADLFDLSLLEEVYAEYPELIAYAG